MQVHEGVGAKQRRCSVSRGFDPRPYPAGTHMCFIYNDDEERVRVLAKFVRSGLENNEQVRYFSASMAPEDIRQRLLDLGVNLSEEATNRQCRFDGALLYRILNVNPMMIVNTVVVRNPYYQDRPISNRPG